MEIIMVIAQRKCSYAGQYAPECLACMSEYGDDDNPDYIAGVLSENRESGEFDAVEVVRLAVDDKAIAAALFPNRTPIQATVISPNPDFQSGGTL